MREQFNRNLILSSGLTLSFVVSVSLLPIPAILRLDPAFASMDELQTYELIMDDGNTYQINATGPINNISGNVTDKSIVILISPTEAGKMRIAIPRAILDASNSDGTDRNFIVLLDYNDFTRPTEIPSDEESRVLEIDYSAQTEVIEIFGSKIVPEFGSLAIPFLVLALIAIIAIGFRSRRFDMRNISRR